MRMVHLSFEPFPRVLCFCFLTREEKYGILKKKKGERNMEELKELKPGCDAVSFDDLPDFSSLSKEELEAFIKYVEEIDPEGT